MPGTTGLKAGLSMYESFFGLRERPFDLVPDPRFLYLTGRQREAMSNLQYGLTTPRGVSLLLGEAGTGKTTLLRAVLSGLSESAIKCVVLSNPTLTRTEFYEFLAQGFGLGEESGTSKTRFLLALKSLLQDEAAAGSTPALVVDEAQSVPYELLEEIRLLSNLETTRSKLLNVVLAGQPELAERLNDPSLRQLKQRVSLRCQLSSMNLQETAAYIAGRIRIAGGQPERVFTRDAITGVFEASGGVPRTVNVVCDNALISGFAAGVQPVTRAVVDEVRRDFDFVLDHRDPTSPARPQVAVPEIASPASGAVAAAHAVSGGGQAPSVFGVFSRKRRFSFF